MYVLTSAKLDAISQRRVASIATYNFSFYYRPCKSNSEADSMSRLHELWDVLDREQIFVDLIKTICKAQCVNIPFLSVCLFQLILQIWTFMHNKNYLDINVKLAQVRHKDIRYWSLIWQESLLFETVYQTTIFLII